MRTHARYELQESTSMDDSGGGSAGGTDSPLSAGSGLITSRSVSSESAELPPANKPPSPMDTGEDAESQAAGERTQEA